MKQFWMMYLLIGLAVGIGTIADVASNKRMNVGDKVFAPIAAGVAWPITVSILTAIAFNAKATDHGDD